MESWAVKDEQPHNNSSRYYHMERFEERNDDNVRETKLKWSIKSIEILCVKRGGDEPLEQHHQLKVYRQGRPPRCCPPNRQILGAAEVSSSPDDTRTCAEVARVDMAP